MKRITVLLAEDHQMVREGFRSLLKHEPDIEVIGEAADGREAVRMTRKLRPEVVVMDIAMPLLNGVEAARQIRKAFPDTKVLFLSAHSDDAYVKDATEVYELEQTLKSVGSFRASIGMATANRRASTEATVKLVSIDGVAPTPENLVNGSYKIGRPLLLVFPKDESKLRSGIKAFLDFVRSPEGQQIAANAN